MEDGEAALARAAAAPNATSDEDVWAYPRFVVERAR